MLLTPSSNPTHPSQPPPLPLKSQPPRPTSSHPCTPQPRHHPSPPAAAALRPIQPARHDATRAATPFRSHRTLIAKIHHAPAATLDAALLSMTLDSSAPPTSSCRQFRACYRRIGGRAVVPSRGASAAPPSLTPHRDPAPLTHTLPRALAAAQGVAQQTRRARHEWYWNCQSACASAGGARRADIWSEGKGQGWR